ADIVAALQRAPGLQQALLERVLGLRLTGRQSPAVGEQRAAVAPHERFEGERLAVLGELRQPGVGLFPQGTLGECGAHGVDRDGPRRGDTRGLPRPREISADVWLLVRAENRSEHQQEAERDRPGGYPIGPRPDDLCRPGAGTATLAGRQPRAARRAG